MEHCSRLHPHVDFRYLPQGARSQRVQEVAAVPVVAEHDPPAEEMDPGVMDIEGMDYSPATRKPPIHN
ncbi:unnamed protein product [Spirodela intermedia]|uniref:Uncharacterized protein n=1 Tax=Spirodela intermedia TaxID=51605 RepID=A0ABN7E9V4_SPIIN|nr:unnamed protein product [Spirodela intermedia]